VVKSLASLVEASESGRRWRIRGSGVRGWPHHADGTAEVVEALKSVGIDVRTYSDGSPANVSSYHCEAAFESGRLTAKTGAYWYESRGAWIEGARALTFVAAITDRRVSGALLREIKRADPEIESYLSARRWETQFVFHVPHASTVVPYQERSLIGLSDEEIKNELRVMTDWFTDELVRDIWPAARRVRFPVSRLILDPERFMDDAQEPMSRIGMGVIYERTSDGRRLRGTLEAAQRESVLKKYYEPHHAALTAGVERALMQHGRCLLFDVHSFPSSPLPYEMDQDPERPDICLGTDELHTPTPLLEVARRTFEAEGLRVAVNRPFAGALVPMKFYRKDARVSSLMIEVNRRLYMDETTGEKLPAFGEVQRFLGQTVARIADGYLRQG
jgi:N-formylglutamate amidohydrolase